MNLISGLAWTACRLLPVQKNKIVISCFYGRGCAGSPKAVAQALQKTGKKLKLVCLTDKAHRDNIPEGIKPASYGALSRIYHLSTAKVWIDNCRKGARFKRKNQYYLQTWHGFAIKRIEKDCGDALDTEYAAYAQRDSAQIDTIISGSRFMTDIYKNGFWYDGEVLETGTPRNDILLGNTAPVRKKVLQKLGLPERRKYVIYAPTFRSDLSTDAYKLDCRLVREAMEQRFGGEWTVLIRLHPNVDKLAENLFPYDGVNVVNVSMYDDIQELCCTGDAMITDYSSVIMDFALTGRPCLQYAVDIEAYKKDRNFYYPLESMPFPLARSNEELVENIRNYDRAEAAELWYDFARKYGLAESGNGSERCAELVLSRM